MTALILIISAWGIISTGLWVLERIIRREQDDTIWIVIASLVERVNKLEQGAEDE